MTELDLIDGLKEEVEIALKGYKLRSAKDNLNPINVYTQNLPVKEGKDDEKMYPYVCICFDDEDIENRDANMNVKVYFIIGIIDRNKDKQGYRDVLHIANHIYQHIFRKGVIAKAFRASYPFRIMIQQDDTYPYFIGGIETQWEMPTFVEEDKYT